MLTERKKILYVVEAMGGGVFTYIVDLANALVDTYDMAYTYILLLLLFSDYNCISKIFDSYVCRDGSIINYNGNRINIY